MEKWIRTDDEQFLKKINENTFEVVEVVGVEETGFKISHQTVNIYDYKDKEILDVIKGYGYNSFEDVRKTYGEDANQIIAECLAETFWATDYSSVFPTVDDALNHILNSIVHLAD